ncbi:MAG TPA: O-antigen ligase family protein, partial [Verrucomicrobiae bacterium]|nr:O-antigen ligase family protein [Verrucomicrobiae bacterium]
PTKLKIAALAIVIIFGLGIFALRFHNYFSAGATSVGARFDYWHAAGQTAFTHPLFGTGPGTFQRPYAQLKSPESEMARLAHNDYLEQFSDSGIGGGIFYAAWIFLALATLGRRVWKSKDQIAFALFAGLLGWFIQGIGEFSLYIPALAWTVFTLLGCLLLRPEIESTKFR